MRAGLAEQSVRRGAQQKSDGEDARSQTRAAGRPRLAQQPRDAAGERSTIGGDRGTEMGGAVRFQLGQRARIRERIAGDRYGHIVAAQFAFGANVPSIPATRARAIPSSPREPRRFPGANSVSA